MSTGWERECVEPDKMNTKFNATAKNNPKKREADCMRSIWQDQKAKFKTQSQKSIDSVPSTNITAHK